MRVHNISIRVYVNNSCLWLELMFVIIRIINDVYCVYYVI